MRLLFVAAALSLSVTAPATAANAPAPPPAATARRAVTMHYPTLEKMLRRFSRQAGEANPRVRLD